MLSCPKCSLASPDSAIVCDCGFAFDSVAAAGIPARAPEKEPVRLSTGAKAITAIGGWLMGGAVGGVISLVSGRDDYGTDFAMAIAGAIVAVRLAKKHQARVIRR